MTTSDQSGPPPRPTPLLLTGQIDEIDLAGRSLRIGSHAVEISGAVPLDGLRVGERVIVKGVREPTSGRILALGLVSQRWFDSKMLARIRSMVVGLLAEVSPAAQVLECALVPEVDRYAVRFRAPQMPDRAVLIARQMVERALHDLDARRTVRNVLESAVTLLRGSRELRRIRREWLRTSLGEGRSWQGSRCVRCEGPLSNDDRTTTEAGGRGHLACPPMS